jgi:hypothetical protein
MNRFKIIGKLYLDVYSLTVTEQIYIYSFNYFIKIKVNSTYNVKRTTTKNIHCDYRCIFLSYSYKKHTKNDKNQFIKIT